MHDSELMSGWGVVSTVSSESGVDGGVEADCGLLYCDGSQASRKK